MKLRPALVALVLCAFVVFPEAGAQQFYFEKFTPENGLPASAVYEVDQDERGYIWIATSEGLARYDGAGFIAFDASTGLREQRIYSMERDAKGGLWLGTEQGASYYDGYLVHNYTSRDGLGRGTVWSIAIDTFGNSWFATHAGGLSVAVNGKFRTFTTDDGLPSDSVYSLFVDTNGRLWVGFLDEGLMLAEVSSSGGLSIIRRWGPAEFPNVTTVREIVQEPESDRMLVGVRDVGIVFVEPDHSIVRPDTAIADLDVYVMTFNNGGRLVTGTAEAGVFTCTPPLYAVCGRLERANGLPSSEVLSVFEDREQNVWIGSSLGLFRWSGHQFILYTEKEGLPSNRVIGVYPESPEVVWISTAHGVTRLDLGRTRRDQLQSRTFTTASGLPADEVWQTLVDSRGRVWFATADGLCLFNEGRGCKTFTEEHGLSGSYLLTVFESSDGAIWVGGTGGASRLTATGREGEFEIESFTSEDGMAGTDVYAIDQGADGKLWFASGGGVNMFDGQRIHAWTPDQGLGVATINDVLVARDGTVWFVTSGSGLVRYDPDKDAVGANAFSSWGKNEGFPSSTMISLVEDEAGLIWIGTLGGIVQVDPARLDSNSGFILKHLVREDGIASHDPGSGNAFAIGAFGDLWFGLATGATRYLPFGPQPPDIPPVVSVETIQAQGQRLFNAPFTYMTDVDDRKETNRLLQIPKKVRDLEIQYRGISLRRQKDVSYQIQLVGHDSDWSSQTERTMKDYTNLAPGKYTFMVRSRIGTGEWGEPAAVAFEIPAVFYERVWFQLLVALLLFAVIYMLHKLRLIAIRERNQELRELVALRTADLEERTRELENANDLIVEADHAKSQFLANMSHELRTPLNSIIGFTEILLDKGGTVGEKAAGRFLTNVSFSANHLLGLINDVLDISKIEAGRMEVHVEAVTIPALVDSVIENLRGLADPRKIVIEPDLPEVLPLVYLDGTKVRQILYNLLSNAVSFSEIDSRVQVTVRHVPSLSSPLGEDTIHMSVTDHGIGIEEEHLASIFDAYQQARATARLGLGTGLGLAIVRRFSELQGGQVVAESTYGEGSVFHVWLPIDAREHDTERNASGRLPVIK